MTKEEALKQFALLGAAWFGNIKQHFALVELGCKPADLQEALKTIEFPFYDDPKQQIETDYYAEGVKLAAAFADDYPTQKLIQKWIDGEAEHMAWEAQYLYQIEKLGYENFLIAMM